MHKKKFKILVGFIFHKIIANLEASIDRKYDKLTEELESKQNNLVPNLKKRKWALKCINWWI